MGVLALEEEGLQALFLFEERHLGFHQDLQSTLLLWQDQVLKLDFIQECRLLIIFTVLA